MFWSLWANYTPGIRSMPCGYNVFVFSVCVCVCVCVCVSVNNFRVRSITLKPLDIFSWNFTQTLNTMSRRAEHKNRNSGFSTFWVIALCVLTIFRVLSITLKPLHIFSWNFTQTLNNMSRRAEHKNRNSGFSTCWVIALCVLTIFRVRSITLKPLDIFSWNFTQTLNTVSTGVQNTRTVILVFLLFELLPFVC